MKKLCSLIVLAALAGTTQAATLKAGTRELGVSGLLDPSGVDGAEVVLDASYGYFVQDCIELGGGLGYADVGYTSLTTLYGFGEYNFDLGTALVPFGGARVGWSSAETEIKVGPGKVTSDQDALTFGLYGGAKFFLVDNIALTAQANLDVATEDIYVNDNDLESINFTLTLGMRFFLP